ncbi:hypothetical protein OHB26_15790 [Nocardia sp. NBC_01503]|uniref:hypothetical protein n=1 Tax=Nocardia sp. NBC_01503 TaxID=2975997 RepID=UPI002E7C07F9|nr:hypothetical protein [Nocardia sp. NBC_01503]WTL35524.1 hypothetical protein OHB26_15790 [Nocardia sp. NBC_01503]
MRTPLRTAFAALAVATALTALAGPATAGFAETGSSDTGSTQFGSSILNAGSGTKDWFRTLWCAIGDTIPASAGACATSNQAG